MKGYDNLMDNFMTLGHPTNSSYFAVNSRNESCSSINKYYKNLLRPVTDADLPWTGMVFGITISAVWYWCSDQVIKNNTIYWSKIFYNQVIVQRALCAKSISHAKAGCILCSILKLSPLYLLVLPGMAARALWPSNAFILIL